MANKRRANLMAMLMTTACLIPVGAMGQQRCEEHLLFSNAVSLAQEMIVAEAENLERLMGALVALLANAPAAQDWALASRDDWRRRGDELERAKALAKRYKFAMRNAATMGEAVMAEAMREAESGEAAECQW